MNKADKYTKTMKAFNEKITQKEEELKTLKEKRNNFMLNAFQEMADRNDMPLPDAFDKFISVMSSVSEDEDLSEEMLEDETEELTESSEIEEDITEETEEMNQNYKNYNK